MKNLLKLLRRNKKWLLLGTLLLVLVFCFSPLALAEPAEEASGDPFDDVAADLMSVVVIGFSFLKLLLYPLVAIVGALMDNELIIGPGMEGKLREIWVIVRDWVNIAFVLALVGIALYNVLGIAGDGSNYALKSILPKIVIGLVAVNFSFLAGKVLLDATAVLTSAVYALPSDLGEWEIQKEYALQNLCDFDENLSDGTFDAAGGKRLISKGTFFSAIFCEVEAGDTGYYSGAFNEFGESYFNNFGAHNVALTLMTNMGKNTDVDLVQFAASSGLNQFTGLTLQMLFGVMLFLLFGFAFVAMVVVLAVRVVILWICLALSPFLVLLFLFPDISSSLGGELDLKTQFFKHLFVPVVMGVVLSIGFTMLSVFQQSSTGSWLGKFSSLSLSDLENLSESGEADDLFGRDITEVQDLIIAISAVIIIWVGVFAAASQTLASTWTGAIKSAGESTGKFLASTPLYATVIPVKTAAGESKIGLMNALGAIPQMMDQVTQRRRGTTNKLANDMLGGTNKERFDADIRDKVHSGNKETIQDALKTRALTTGAKDVEWKGLLTAEVLAKLGLPEDKFKGKSNGEIYKLLQNNPDLQKKVFGEEMPRDLDQWGKKDIPETEKSEPAKKTKEKTKAEEAAEASAARRAKVEPAVKALKASPNARTLDDVGNNQAVSAALNQMNLTDEEAQDLFDNKGTAGLPTAIDQYVRLGAKVQSKDFLKRVKMKDGKIDADSFVQAVTAVAKENGGEDIVPGSGGVPPVAPAAPGGAPALGPDLSAGDLIGIPAPTVDSGAPPEPAP